MYSCHRNHFNVCLFKKQEMPYCEPPLVFIKISSSALCEPAINRVFSSTNTYEIPFTEPISPTRASRPTIMASRNTICGEEVADVILPNTISKKYGNFFSHKRIPARPPSYVETLSTRNGVVAS